MIEARVGQALGQSLPPPIEDSDLEKRVQVAVADSGRKVVALDDDPTGVQTVHDVAVLAVWDAERLAAELADPAPLFFILTNSRALPEDRAAALNREIARNLLDARRESGVPFVIASRSDSTLRGHFPAETDALAAALGGIDGVLICPAFFEGDRVTAGDVHLVRDGDWLVPAAETEFARDATFGYSARSLTGWVEEKTHHRIKTADVASLTLEEIRRGGPERVAARLRGARHEQPIVVNALDYPDLWTVVLGLLQAEAEGKRFLYRTGASFVRARAGIAARPLLRRDELLGPNAPRPRQVDDSLETGQSPVVYTSRHVERPDGMEELVVARVVSDALVAIVRGIEARPDFVVGKGGITSSDVGTRGLGAERATVLGQVRPGVPVWRLGPESRFPGMPYIVFPGNVGEAETLAEIVTELIGSQP
ncbi:MAG: hypothetical protein K0R44_3326 [Thermomicrobiales bacterium]|nr:hypothetical protein [Thermomicrobiales bacterium]